MTNGNKYHSFSHFLYESGEFNKAQYGCFRHVSDIEMKEFLVKLGIITQEHANYLWSQYVRGEGYFKDRREL